jgi:K+ transporter
LRSIALGPAPQRGDRNEVVRSEDAKLSLLAAIAHDTLAPFATIGGAAGAFACMTLRTAAPPRVSERDIVSIAGVAPNAKRVTLTFGAMQTPNVSRGLTLARAKGPQLDILKTSFFVSRRNVTPGCKRGFARVQDQLFAFLMRSSASATDFFHIPTSRVVELGDEIVV